MLPATKSTQGPTWIFDKKKKSLCHIHSEGRLFSSVSKPQFAPKKNYPRRISFATCLDYCTETSKELLSRSQYLALRVIILPINFPDRVSYIVMMDTSKTSPLTEIINQWRQPKVSPFPRTSHFLRDCVVIHFLHIHTLEWIQIRARLRRKD